MEKMVKFSSGFNIDIHEDVLVQILHRLPVKSLMRFSCVCKLWYYLINNNQQQFNKFHMLESQKKPILVFTFKDCDRNIIWYYLEKENHANHTLLPYEEAITLKSYRDRERIIGYDNGLACYQNNYDGVLFDCEWAYISLSICNHSRHEMLIIMSRLSRLQSKSRIGDEFFCGFRFGYDILGNEYKVMCIMEYYDEYEYYIITVGSTNPWRKINNPWPKQCPRDYISDSGGRRVLPISCNGTLYYGTVKDKVEKELYKRIALVSFDLHCEKFQIIELPGDDEFVSNYNKGDSFPMEYKGCFCYSYMEKIDPYSGKVVLHIFKDTFKQVWVKDTIKFNLPRELHDPAPASSTRVMNFSNQVLLYWRFHNFEDGYVIHLYNVHSKELKKVKHPAKAFSLNSDYYNIFDYTENFTSLKTLATATGEESTRGLKEYKTYSCYREKYFFENIPTSTNQSVISILDPSYSSQK